MIPFYNSDKLMNSKLNLTMKGFNMNRYITIDAALIIKSLEWLNKAKHENIHLPCVMPKDLLNTIDSLNLTLTKGSNHEDSYNNQ